MKRAIYKFWPLLLHLTAFSSFNIFFTRMSFQINKNLKYMYYTKSFYKINNSYTCVLVTMRYIIILDKTFLTILFNNGIQLFHV